MIRRKQLKYSIALVFLSCATDLGSAVPDGGKVPGTEVLADGAIEDAAADSAPVSHDAMSDASRPMTSLCGCPVPTIATSGTFEGGITGSGTKTQYDTSKRTCGISFSLTDPRYTFIMDPDARCSLAWTRQGDGSLSAATTFWGDPYVAAPYGPAIPLPRQSESGCSIDLTLPDGATAKVLHVAIEGCACAYSYRYYYPLPANPFQSCDDITAVGSSGPMVSPP